jgi:hypothetical protein
LQRALQRLREISLRPVIGRNGDRHERSHVNGSLGWQFYGPEDQCAKG